MTRRKQRQSRTCPLRGFSITEVVCVAVIIGILAAIAAPRFSNSLARQRVEGAARRIVVDLALVRRHAKVSGASQTVDFDVGDDLYRLVGMKHLDHDGQEYAVSLAQEPYQVGIVSADFGGHTDIVFDIHGMPDNGGSVVIQVGNHFRTISVDPVTGEASVQ